MERFWFHPGHAWVQPQKLPGDFNRQRRLQTTRVVDADVSQGLGTVCQMSFGEGPQSESCLSAASVCLRASPFVSWETTPHFPFQVLILQKNEEVK